MREFQQAEFIDPGAQYRAMPFWSWNTKISRKLIQDEIPIFKEMGFGGYIIHARTGLDTEYLGEEFMRDIQYSVEKGEENQLYTGLYDEDRWPSGYGGGMVTANSEFRAKHLLFTTQPINNTNIEQAPANANFSIGVRSGNGILLSVYDIVTDEKGYLVSYKLIDDTMPVVGAKWYAYIEENPGHPWYNGSTYVDVLNEEAIDSFIDFVYKRYEQNVGKEFGKLIPLIFTDEPHMTFKSNLKNPFDNQDCFFPWTGKLTEIVQKEYGFSLVEKLPLLFWQEKNGDEVFVRYCYNRAVSDLFECSYARNIGTWCKEHGIAFTGHYLFEETLFMQNRSDGDLMRMYSHMDLPGMDLLFDDVALTTAKQLQSVVHQLDKRGAVSEEYGGTNWSEEFRDYLFQGNWHAALGITLRVPHLAHMSLAGEGKRDFPASIFYQAPWYKEWKQLEDHFARIGYVMSLGKSVVKIAIIHPIESYWIMFGPDSQTNSIREKADREFGELCKWLLYQNLDFDYLDEGMITSLYNGGKQFGAMNYDVILVPNLREMRYSTYSILNDYKENGGTVFILGNFPKYFDGKSLDDSKRTFKHFEKIPFLKKSIIERLETFRIVQVEDEKGQKIEEYLMQLRSTEEEAFFYLCDMNKGARRSAGSHDDCDTNVKIRKICINSCDYQYIYSMDTWTGNFSILPSKMENCKLIITCMIPMGNDLLLRMTNHKVSDGEFTNEKTDIINHNVGEQLVVASKVQIELEEPNVFLLDTPEYKLDQGEWQAPEEILRIDNELRNKLSFPIRGSSMMQPYRCMQMQSRHKVCLRYQIFSKVEMNDIYIALENRSETQLMWNGSNVENTSDGWYIDRKFEKVLLGKLVRGNNTLELTMLFHEKTALEGCYLLGKFGVMMKKGEILLTDIPKTISWGNVVPQGFFFYGGNLIYHITINTHKGKLCIKIPDYSGALIGIMLDGERKGSIIASPYSLTINNVSEGEHDLRILLFGNRYNTLSHLHSCSDKHVSRPSQWREEGENWVDGYCTLPFGVMCIPQIETIS